VIWDYAAKTGARAVKFGSSTNSLGYSLGASALVFSSLYWTASAPFGTSGVSSTQTLPAGGKSMCASARERELPGAAPAREGGFRAEAEERPAGARARREPARGPVSTYPHDPRAAARAARSSSGSQFGATGRCGVTVGLTSVLAPCRTTPILMVPGGLLSSATIAGVLVKWVSPCSAAGWRGAMWPPRAWAWRRGRGGARPALAHVP
jgi:hypothetical protein